ncbi:hypothetical protein [uncultured Maribacter sp.]|uniref:hypothetical protein n=1 Tax=uncultured Maribacter sp. TaxID=431308 RepID=UPI0026113A03|nr:hypothetical protein [uncultured Maribacter sp.]
MSLSKEEIVFIDSYLIKADIQFMDIRMEMVDHIAVGIETKMTEENINFYNAFRDYMIVHKKGLIQSYESQKRVLKEESLFVLLRNFTKPYAIVLILVISFLRFIWKDISSIEFPDFQIVLGLELFTISTYYVIRFFDGKNRFSVIESLVWPLNIFGFLVIILIDNSSLKTTLYTTVPLIIDISVIFIISLYLIFLITFFKMKKEVKNKYSIFIA